MSDENIKAVLEQLIGVFLEENKKLNLSAFRTPEQCRIGNMLDSLAFTDIAPKLFGRGWESAKLNILDLGTGGGFPLLPLAITMSNARFTGLDATAKKIDAVGRIAQALELKNIHLLCGRVEEAGRDPQLRGTFDVVTARAVAPIATLLEYAVPLLKLHGIAVFWKSTNIQSELRASESAARALRVTLCDQHTYELLGDWGKRTLLVYEKQAITPEEFPRKVGVPKQKPLL